MSFKKPQLWQDVFSDPDNKDHADALKRLDQVYAVFWDRAVTLANQIQVTIPALTLHDETHFNALWDMVQLIVSPEQELNPLELFVLGGAILIHDAANCAAAFPGGEAEIMKTAQWLDAEGEIRQRRDEARKGEPLSENEHKLAMLNTLRGIHASRAETLYEMKVTVNGQDTHLINDDTIRNHLGRLIGRIAASHHWNVDDLSKRGLRLRTGAPSEFPGEWSIRPVLLACILRCADAIQLDQRRTPDFLYGLLKPEGLSDTHWNAQSYLGQPTLDDNDPRAICFTSTQEFESDQAPAWWVAFDSLNMANGELQSVDALLRDRKLPPLRINRIAGAEAPDRLADHVQVRGWKPVNAEVRISHVDKIVEMFGGKQLYGDDLRVPLRELIQNAADSIRARRALEKEKGIEFEGAITIRLIEETRDGVEGYRLEVDDDGIGMSEAVLAGPLIDFGTGYLNSALVRNERPGLVGLNVKRTGQYGIGFFSVFMLGDQVRVTSRPYEEGVRDARTLAFNHGVSGRPLLLDEAPGDYGSQVSTRVSVFMTAEQVEALKLVKVSLSIETLSINQIINSLVPLLDVNVWLHQGEEKTHVHDPDEIMTAPISWLKKITPLAGGGYSGDSLLYSKDTVDEHADQLRQLMMPIDPSDLSRGFAGLYPIRRSGLYSVGMLTSTNSLTMYRSDFVGVINRHSSGPVRSHSALDADPIYFDWLDRQIDRIKLLNFPKKTLGVISENICLLGGNPRQVATVKTSNDWMTLTDVYDVLKQGAAIYTLVRNENSEDSEYFFQVGGSKVSGGKHSYTQLCLLQSSYHSKYSKIPINDDSQPFCFLSLLAELAGENGKALDYKFGTYDLLRYEGLPSEKDGLTTGQIIPLTAFKITLKDAES